MHSSFRTIINPAPPPFRIGYGDHIVSIGSCFSENIGLKLAESKFKVCINPFGQQYNPHSVADALKRLLQPEPFAENDLVFHDELYHSFAHHGSFSRPAKQEALQVINQNLAEAAVAIKQASVLFLTFGAAHVFIRRDTSGIVSNCHKLSGNYFHRRLLQPAEIVTALEDALTHFHQANPKAHVVLTISPVRYFAFGHYENSVSKAHLFTAIHELLQRHAGYYYFPAYELIMDDLRDYRFFAEDMLHPNYEATRYVWQVLCDTMLEKDAKQLLPQVEEIMRAVRHRPRNPASHAHQKFIASVLSKMEALEKNSGLDFTAEKSNLQRAN